MIGGEITNERNFENKESNPDSNNRNSVLFGRYTRKREITFFQSKKGDYPNIIS